VNKRLPFYEDFAFMRQFKLLELTNHQLMSKEEEKPQQEKEKESPLKYEITYGNYIRYDCTFIID
jgi:hypothetical protein